MIRSLVVWAAVLSGSRVALADDTEGKPACSALVARAAELHAAEKYREALAASERAYACDPQPALLFAMGQSAFNLGDYVAAGGYYQRFIDSKPDPDAAALALQALAVTNERIEEAKRPVPVVIRNRPADRLAWGLAIAGGAAMLGGGGLYAVAHQRVVDTSGTYAQYDARVGGARTLRIAAVGCEALGAGLVIWAAVRWLGRDDVQATPRSSLVPIGGGDVIGLAVGGPL